MIPIREKCSSYLNEFDESKDRLGKCYMYAYKEVEKLDTAILVHGYITDPIHGRVIDHAWVEVKNIVYDPTLDKKFPKAKYDSLFNPEIVKKYNKEEMYEKALKTGNFGPWHKIPKGKVRWWRV